MTASYVRTTRPIDQIMTFIQDKYGSSGISISSWSNTDVNVDIDGSFKVFEDFMFNVYEMFSSYGVRFTNDRPVSIRISINPDIDIDCIDQTTQQIRRAKGDYYWLKLLGFSTAIAVAITYLTPYIVSFGRDVYYATLSTN